MVILNTKPAIITGLFKKRFQKHYWKSRNFKISRPENVLFWFIGILKCNVGTLSSELKRIYEDFREMKLYCNHNHWRMLKKKIFLSNFIVLDIVIFILTFNFWFICENVIKDLFDIQNN